MLCLLRNRPTAARWPRPPIARSNGAVGTSSGPVDRARGVFGSDAAVLRIGRDRSSGRTRPFFGSDAAALPVAPPPRVGPHPILRGGEDYLSAVPAAGCVNLGRKVGVDGAGELITVGADLVFGRVRMARSNRGCDAGEVATMLGGRATFGAGVVVAGPHPSMRAKRRTVSARSGRIPIGSGSLVA